MVRFKFMIFNATFNSISLILWRLKQVRQVGIYQRGNQEPKIEEGQTIQ